VHSESSSNVKLERVSLPIELNVVIPGPGYTGQSGPYSMQTRMALSVLVLPSHSGRRQHGAYTRSRGHVLCLRKALLRPLARVAGSGSKGISRLRDQCSWARSARTSKIQMILAPCTCACLQRRHRRAPCIEPPAWVHLHATVHNLCCCDSSGCHLWMRSRTLVNASGLLLLTRRDQEGTSLM
jgi:hypothetical protein